MTAKSERGRSFGRSCSPKTVFHDPHVTTPSHHKASGDILTGRDFLKPLELFNLEDVIREAVAGSLLFEGMSSGRIATIVSDSMLKIQEAAYGSFLEEGAGAGGVTGEGPEPNDPTRHHEYHGRRATVQQVSNFSPGPSSDSSRNPQAHSRSDLDPNSPCDRGALGGTGTEITDAEDARGVSPSWVSMIYGLDATGGDGPAQVTYIPDETVAFSAPSYW